jgi:hypothetical protein
MDRSKFRLHLLWPALLALSLLLVNGKHFRSLMAQSQSARVTPVAADTATVARLQADVQALTRFPSRVPGTPGNLQAAQYVETRFKQISAPAMCASKNTK